MMKSIVTKYKGWLVALSLGLAFPLLTNYYAIPEISKTYLRDLINKKEIASILIVKNRLYIRERYNAEITLTPAALRKYEEHGFTFSSSRMSPHLSTFVGLSTNEVNKWEMNLDDRNTRSFSIRKNY